MAEGWLLLDAGNTRIKWAELGDKGLERSGSLPTKSIRNQLSALDAAWESLNQPRGVALSNVAGPEVREALSAYVQNRWGMPVQIAVSRSEGSGVRSAYRVPESLGIDRWLALIATRARYELPAVIVDAGSAVTIDLLNGEGRHEGGYILPGRMAMVSALVRGTAQLALPSTERGAGLQPARDTDTALSSGAVLALVGGIDHVFREHALVNESRSPVLVLTGGDADLLASLLASPAKKHPDLVLEGLWRYLWDEGFLEPHCSPFLSKR